MNTLFLSYSLLFLTIIVSISLLSYFTFIKKTIKIKDYSFILVGFALFVNIFLLIDTASEVNGKLSFEIKAPDGIYTTSESDSTVTTKKLYQYLLTTKIPNPEVIYCQAIIESNSFKSELYKRNKNLFGMKLPEVRITSGSAITGVYQKYANWKLSVTDYMLWAIQNKTVSFTQDQYINYLQKIYAEDQNYGNKIRKMLKEIDFKNLEK